MSDREQASALAAVVFRAIDVAVDMCNENVYRATWAIMRGRGVMERDVAEALVSEGYPEPIVREAVRVGEAAYAQASRWLK